MNKNKIILFKNRNNTNTVPKSMIYYFKIVHVCLGLDFGFIKLKKGQNIVKLSSVLFAAFFSALCVIVFIYNLDLVQIIWYTLYLSTYFIEVFILAFSGENNFCSLQNDLIYIDLKLGVNSKSYKIATKIILSTIGAILYKVLFIGIYCGITTEYCINLLLGTIFFFIPLISIDLILIIYFFVFYSLYCRVATIVELVVGYKLNLTSCQFCYKALLKSAEKALVTFNKVVSF